MKIVHLCLACFYIDEHSYQENMLPKYHKKMGHDVVVIASLQSFDRNGNPCYLDSASKYMCNDGYKIVRVEYKKIFKRINRILKQYKNTYNLIEREKPDIIFIHGSQFIDIRKVIKYIKKHKHVKVYVDNHSDFINSATNWISRNILHRIIWKYYTKSINHYTNRFYGVTPLRCDFLNNVYNIPHDKIDLLVLGADDDKINLKNKNRIKQNIRKKLNISNNDFVIITGGKIEKRKNIHLLMQAVCEMNNETIKLIIFGTSNREMKSIIDSYKKSKSIINIGWVKSDEIYDYFLSSDLVVFPGTHSVLWEQSVGAGIPGVFKYWEGMDHIDLGGNCRFLFKNDVSEIKNVLIEIINNPEVYKKMKKVAEEEGVTTFSYRAIAERSISEKQNRS